MGTKLVKMYDDAISYLYPREIEQNGKAIADKAKQALEYDKAKDMPIAEAYATVVKQFKVSSKQPKDPLAKHADQHTIPSYQSLGLKPVTTLNRAAKRPNGYIYQSWADQHPQGFAEKLGEKMYDRTTGFTASLRNQAVQAVIALEKQCYWSGDITYGFRSAMGYDNLSSVQDYIALAANLTKQYGQMGVQSYNLPNYRPVRKVAVKHKSKQNMFMDWLIHHVKDTSVYWDKDMLCPRCHHRSLIQPAVDTYHDVNGKPSINPVCLHCGFKYWHPEFVSAEQGD